MPSAYPGASAAPKRRWSGLSALLAGVLTALLVVTGFNAAPAMAANGTVDLEFSPGTSVHNGKPVYEEGQSYTLGVKYNRDEIEPGHTAVITVPKGFTITEAPKSNTAVKSFDLKDGTLTVQFHNPIPVANGGFDLQFTVDTVTESSEQTVNWGLNGNPVEQTIVIKKADDTLKKVEDYSNKDGRGANFPKVTIDAETGQVVLGEDFLSATMNYEIKVNSKDARTVVIEDKLATGTTLVPGSFSMSKTWWDAQGMNRQAAEVDMTGVAYEGAEFSHTFEAEQNSEYVLRYQAKIADAAALATLRDQLQAQYELVKDKNGARFEITLANEAMIAGVAGKKTYAIGGSTPQEDKPNYGAAFKKDSTLKGDIPITLKGEGPALEEPLPITYTLTADLTQFKKFDGKKYGLQRNVVITDTLPTNQEWQLGEGFLSPELELVAGVSLEDFAGDAYVGKYMVDGQVLRINVGKSVEQTHTITAKAALLSVAGLDVHTDPEGRPYVATLFNGVKNSAHFAFDEGAGTTVDTTGHVVTKKDPSTGINDKEKFKKNFDSKTIVLEEGQTFAELPFTFTVGQGIGDAQKSTIVDFIDHTVLDVTEETLPAIQKSITGKYAWEFPIDGSTFDVSLNDDGNLVFAPNANFPKPTAGNAAKAPYTGNFEFTVMIPTKPIEGKSAITVKNEATYQGEDRDIVFNSHTQASAGVGGREIDVKKTVYNAAKDEFTTNLRAGLNEDGTLVTDEFVYRVQFMPTLEYSKMLFDITDQLVDNLEFVGFVNPDQVKSGETAGKGKYTIPGTELSATFSEADNRITIAKNQKIAGGKVTELFFKVKIKDFVDGEGVENAIGPEKVTITPTNDMPLDISKLNEMDPTADPITDRDARFELRDSAGEVVLSDLYIVGGKLRMAGKNGGDAVPTVKVAGTYTVHELKAPQGFVKKTEPVVLVVAEDGTSQETKFFNTPRSAVKKVSVGDYVWLDSNRDGIQDRNEKPIEGVKLVLTGPNGEQVTDIDGNLVEPTVTNADGFYEFVDLPALEQGQTYTVSIAQEDEGTKAALDGLVPTKENGTEDREKDSSTWTAVSRDDLVNDGDRDPSLDFGFHTKSVSVGDYVWLDIDGDGVQGTDANETPIEGVKLVLTGPDGKPVTDVFGQPVEPAVTNDKGFYEFPDLPALKDGETYTVSIDREDEGTQKALEGLVPTKVEGTDDRELDSSEWTAVSRDDLVNDGDRDPSLDFGFRPKSVSVGDYVWLDVDGDGVQGTDANETPIEGVKLVLTGPDGQPVTDIFGNEVKPTVTNDKGFYEFPDLPALKDGETYTVSIDREDEGTQKALEGLIPTKVEGTDDRELDSSEWTAVSRDDLVNDGDRDPSLDFGFRYKTYAIGDVVWIDTNKDGLQGESEYTLKDVIVRLFDEQGNLVAETTTDKNGLYVFDELRAGKYRVQFELTPAQAKVYSFTKTGGGDTALDSDAGKDGFSRWIVLDDSNAELTLDYPYADLVGGIKATQGIDPTWDAGVIVKKVIDEGPGPEGPGPKDPGTDNPGKPGKQDPTGTPNQPKGSVTLGGLAVTGGSFGWAYAAGGAALLVLGAGALLLARRRSGAHA